MSRASSQFVYRDVGPEGIEEVRPLWEKLNAHHADLSLRFGGGIRVRTFDVRKQKLLAKGGADSIRVELVSVGLDKPVVAYCISTVSDDGVGEIDSLYVNEDLRSQGVGSELMRRALGWLEGKKVVANTVSVMSDNGEALAFYRRFNFHPRTIFYRKATMISPNWIALIKLPFLLQWCEQVRLPFFWHHAACQRGARWNGRTSNKHHRIDRMEHRNASTTQSRRFPAVRCLLIGQFVSLLLAVTAFAGPRNAPVIDQLFAQWNRGVSPGAALVIVKDGAVVYEHGYGYASLEHRVRITPQTVFEAGSMGKQFTGFAVAALMDQGKLSIDDDIRKYLPQVPDFGKPIRIEHLLYHTSGLRDWVATLELSGVNQQEPIDFSVIYEMVQRQRELNFAPGEQYLYCNTGYNLLAAIVAKVSGKSFHAWTEESIFRPLGMKHTAVRTNSLEVIDNLADSYAPAAGGSFHRINSQIATPGSGGLMITAEDMGKWLLNFETLRVGGKAVLDRMQQPGKLNNGEKVKYGFGVVPDTYQQGPTIYHFGNWAGYRSFFMWIPQKRFGFAILANVDDPKALPIHEILNHYVGPSPTSNAPASFSPPNPVARFKADPLSWNEFLGTYRLGRKSLLTITLEGNQLTMQATGGKKCSLIPVSDHGFCADTNGSVIEFIRQESGAVTNLIYQDIRASKIDLSQSTPSQVAAFAGDYWSEELRSVTRLEVHAGKLATQFRSGQWSYFLPTGPNSFDGDWATLEFTRNSASVPIELRLSEDRVRNIRYTRIILSGTR